MSGMSKPVQLGATIALSVLLIGAVIAGLVWGDDLHELWDWGKDAQSTTERVQIQGIWMGMRLVPATQPSELGPPAASGVRVTEVSETYGWRARSAGLAPGDIITALNGKKIGALTDLDALSEKLDASTAIQVDVLRWGQPYTVTIPAVANVPAPGAPLAAPPGMMPASRPLNGYGPPAGGGMGPAGPGGATTGVFYCPKHRQTFTAAQVQPYYRCPLCAGPLTPGQ